MAAISVKISEIQNFFQIQLTENQIRGIKGLAAGQDVFVGTRTGSGKSLIYESCPIIFGESSVCVVISPLLSIMKEQVNRLSGLGLKATYIGKKDCCIDDVTRGFQFVFGNPEVLVGNDKWRGIFRHPEFSQRHKLTVIDEAHTVYQWGEKKDSDDAFREHFSKIGELRSLSLNIPLLSLTATASPSNRKRILKSLCFRDNHIVIIDSPDRPNIKINVKCVKNNSDISDIFSWVIDELNSRKKNAQRIVIFCESIKDCAVLYTMFRRKCDASLVQMFHSKTAEHIKEKIRIDMESEDGQIRVLISTNAAGMGVNFKGLHNVVHYGPPRDLDTLVQQMGRAGRDGEFSVELILYKNHKGHLKKIDSDVLSLIKSEDQCRRNILCKAYNAHSHIFEHLHECCDFCEKTCKCLDCPRLSHPVFNAIEPQEEDAFQRDVTDENKITLKHKLELLQSNLPKLFGNNSELSVETIKCITDNCHRIFTTSDVMEYGTIWLLDTAEQVIKIFDDVFDDIIIYGSSDSENDFT